MNIITGPCREHSSGVKLTFDEFIDAENVWHEYQNGMFHLSKEMFVVALLPLSKSDPAAKPILFSPSCKTDVKADHIESLLAQVIGVVIRSLFLIGYELWWLGSDGDGIQREALRRLTLSHRIGPDHPLWQFLGTLRGFDLRCGRYWITGTFDLKHVLKRWASLFRRPLGILIGVTLITPSVLLSVLSQLADLLDDMADDKYTRDDLHRLLFPDDKQNVPLATALLSYISAVAGIKEPEVTMSTSPSQVAQLQVLRVLANLVAGILAPIFKLDLSLSEQLIHLSTYAHLVWAIYDQSGAAACPTQLVHDSLFMIKNMYFTAARTAALNDPNAECYLCLDGTDKLEENFGQLRTEHRCDTTLDGARIPYRAIHSHDVATTLQNHPDWKPPSWSWRTGVKSSLNGGFDHVSPSSYKGDLRASKVDFQRCWDTGRSAALKVAEDNPLASLGSHLARFGTPGNCLLEQDGVDFFDKPAKDSALESEDYQEDKATEPLAHFVRSHV